MVPRRPPVRIAYSELIRSIRRILLILVCMALGSALTLLRLHSNANYPGEDVLMPMISAFSSQKTPAIVPFDLSVNHLQRRELAKNGSPLLAVPEDFLPIISGTPELRFRLKPTVGGTPSAIRDISAYQIQAQHAYSSSNGKVELLWDSGKVEVNTMPRSITWSSEKLTVGTVVKWRVLVWDGDKIGPMTSSWSKFAVGPNHDGWTGQWITHPVDATSFAKEANLWRAGVNNEQCNNWMKRRYLPIARAKIHLKEQKELASALLVVSGLGSFQASLDGIPLSSSSVLDPPMTDYTQRVNYRGYDITSHLISEHKTPHVISVTLGSGWWDARPITASIIKLNLMPRGPPALIAELHVTFTDGTSVVKIPTSPQDWQVTRGYLYDSDLFTGETVDLGIMEKLKGWDTVEGWSTSSSSWIDPVFYKSDITTEQWRQELSERSGAKNVTKRLHFIAAPIGKVVPMEIPPILPIERLAPESVTSLGDGRWLYDFGKAMSGAVRFENGLEYHPITPKHGYPRAHSVITPREDEKFITVVYGESIEPLTGDINLALVAGMGMHNGGARPNPKVNVRGNGGPCFPRDHEQVLTQRDVYIGGKDFSQARQPLFTSHGFRFAEVCCTALPPENVLAIAYRTAFQDWGQFDSSNVVLNGAYEMTKNALSSNMLGTQTDCPHREKLQYGGDLVADSPAAMHFFDLGAFYKKIIHDWTDTQWDNGAYTETSIWLDLNEYAAIGHGAGETVWASAPAVLTVRHAQHYGDEQLLKETFPHHVKWLKFLNTNWNAGMDKLFYNRVGKNLENYRGSEGGLGDWLAMLTRDVWLTHHAFYMASARCIAYLVELQGFEDNQLRSWAMSIADGIKERINELYMVDDKFRIKRGVDWTPGADLGLFARIVPGQKRCKVLNEWLHLVASGKSKSSSDGEEGNFLRDLNERDLNEMIQLGIAEVAGSRRKMVSSRRHNMHEGIFAVRYSLKTLSDMGVHHIALSKAGGIGHPSYEYMLSHNATTLWETFFRSEDVFSRNHPMLGAVAEWLSSSVAGVSLAPTTVGGEALLFWPRIPTSALVVHYASATQGTKRGDASIAWEFLDLPRDTRLYDSAIVKVHIRLLVPPGSTATLRLPNLASEGAAGIKHATILPDLVKAKSNADARCALRRLARKGFGYNWEYDRNKKEWSKFHNGKAIGTPCKSFLFDSDLSATQWSQPEPVVRGGKEGSDIEIKLDPGLFDVVIENWQLVKEIEDSPGYASYSGDMGPYCSDPSAFSWEANDATHII